MRFGFFSVAIAAGFTVGLALAAPAQAGTITTFLGQDVVAVTGPFTNSDAARASFLTAAEVFGAVDTHGVGHQTVGDSSGTWLNGDGTWAITGPCCVASFSGVTKTQTNNPSDGFQEYNGGGGNLKWLGLNTTDSVTYNNTSPTNSFGAYFSGLNGGTLQISFNDGASQLITIPVTTNGGAEYWGFTDTTVFSSFTIADLSGDNFGIDGVSFNSVNTTPLPAALPLFATGLGALGLLGWRRKRKAAA
jgi:hypothetical protein